MKNLLFFNLAFFLAFSVSAQQPLVAHAGDDTVFCDVTPSGNIGHVPAATGGTSPYAYHWKMMPDTINQGQNNEYTIAEVLSDTLAANPVIESFPSYGDSVLFVLTVEDAVGATDTDTVSILSNSKSYVLGNEVHEIRIGDTVETRPFLSSEIFPVIVDWGTFQEPMRLGEQYDTLHSNNPQFSKQFVFNQAHPTPQGTNYTITNAGGCVRNEVSFKVFLVYPVSTEDLNAESEKIRIYPNPNAQHQLQLASDVDIETLNIYGINGSLVLSKVIERKAYTTDISALDAGIYIVELILRNGKIDQHKLIKQ